MEYRRPSEIENEIGTQIITAAIKVHKKLGPGLLEKIYESCLEYELKEMGLKVDRQVNIALEYDGVELDVGLKIDLLVNGSVIVELKSSESHHKVWEAQVISYLRLTYLNLGYLINFNVPLLKQGIRRFRMDEPDKY